MAGGERGADTHAPQLLGGHVGPWGPYAPRERAQRRGLMSLMLSSRHIAIGTSTVTRLFWSPADAGSATFLSERGCTFSSCHGVRFRSRILVDRSERSLRDAARAG